MLLSTNNELSLSVYSAVDSQQICITTNFVKGRQQRRSQRGEQYLELEKLILFIFRNTVSTIVFAVNFNVTFHHENQKEGDRGFISNSHSSDLIPFILGLCFRTAVLRPCLVTVAACACWGASGSRSVVASAEPVPGLPTSPLLPDQSTACSVWLYIW